MSRTNFLKPRPAAQRCGASRGVAYLAGGALALVTMMAGSAVMAEAIAFDVSNAPTAIQTFGAARIAPPQPPGLASLEPGAAPGQRRGLASLPDGLPDQASVGAPGIPAGVLQATAQQPNGGLLAAGWGGSAETSPAGFNAMLQKGDANNAMVRMSASPAAGNATLQYGIGNGAWSVIHASPGSSIAQTQIGTGNAGLVGIFGGRDNRVATAQVGEGLSLAVGLVNSVGTDVIYGQAGQDVNGGVVIMNAPAGTVVRLN